MFYSCTYSAKLFCLTFQRAALDSVTAGWGLCTIIGVNVGDSGLRVSSVELIMGRTLNGTSFGGQFFFLLIFFIVALKF